MHQNNAGQLTNTIIRNTEIGRADKFIGNIKNTHCYIKETSQWHIFNGTVWEQDDKRLVQQKAMDFIKDEGRRIASIDDDNIREEARHDFTRHANRAAVNNLTELAAVQLVNTVGRFDTDRMAMALENGWVDLNSCTFNPPDPDKLFSLQAAVPYKATEPAKLWRETVNQVFSNQEDLVVYFQKAIGYSLLGGNPEQLLFICHGAGANGKSLLLETIRNVLGTYAQAMPISTLMRGKQNAGAASPELSRLRGVRFALAAETEKGQAWSANRIKTLTGGDMIAARGLYKDIIEFRSDATIWVACNHKPEVDSSDEAMWRRLRLIPFNRVFSRHEQDPELSGKLKAEYPGILIWMLQGLRMYLSQGHLEEPREVKMATTRYRDEMDSVKRFLGSNAKLQPNESETVADIKEAYLYWCKDEGLKPLAASQFNAALEAAGCQQSKSNATRIWRGIKLVDTDVILQRFMS